jgi:hypothetical protein
MLPKGLNLRKDGKEKATCPYCGSRQVSWTMLFPTRIVLREDLLMLTDGKYPREYLPLTSTEEIDKFPYIVNARGLKIFISRGWGDPEFGHYVYLMLDGKMWMTTQRDEHGSMMESLKDCPTNARVFIAGLGLGLVLLYLAKSGKSYDVVVVEKDGRVIDAVESRIRNWLKKFYPDFRWKVFQGDAYDAISNCGTFDWMFWDIWPQMFCNDLSWTAECERIRTICNPVLNPHGKVTCWKEITNDGPTQKWWDEP